MNASEARWQTQQAEALAGALIRTLERSVQAVEGAEPVVRDVAQLALLDAQALLQRVHALRKRAEGLGSE